MKYHTVNLKDYPYQPIRDFAAARNWFIKDLADDEYLLFTSDHEEVPRMLHDYISRLDPKYPYYKVRLICLVNGVQAPLKDPNYVPNLCSNRTRFKGRLHERAYPLFRGGTIDIPMLHNSDGKHSYHSWESKWDRVNETNLIRQLLWNWRAVLWTRMGRGVFRQSREQRHY